jgi:hypothetical protein
MSDGDTILGSWYLVVFTRLDKVCTNGNKVVSELSRIRVKQNRLALIGANNW